MQIGESVFENAWTETRLTDGCCAGYYIAIRCFKSDCTVLFFFYDEFFVEVFEIHGDSQKGLHAPRLLYTLHPCVC